VRRKTERMLKEQTVKFKGPGGTECHQKLDAAWSVCLSLCLSVCYKHCKTVELITEVTFLGVGGRLAWPQ